MIYLYGSGGHAKVILDILHKQNRWPEAFLDDNPPHEKKQIHGVPIYLASEILPKIDPKNSQWIVAIGNNKIRQQIAHQLQNQGHTFTTAIHPSAQIALGVEIAHGTVVMANAVINTDTKIGHHVIVNTGATIDHDCIIKDYAHIAPGCALCGGVKIGERVLLGVGSAVCPTMEIGDGTICGAGTIIVKSMPSDALIYGCPGKIIKTNYSKSN